MVRNADVAMYMAKAGGKAGFAVFDPAMHQATHDRHELAMELQHAVDLDQLILRYQPIIDLETGRVAGVEALVRWQHPERGLVPPGDFIEIAEEHGSILPIGRWVLGEACRQTPRGPPTRPCRPTCSCASTSRRARSRSPASWMAFASHSLRTRLPRDGS